MMDEFFNLVSVLSKIVDAVTGETNRKKKEREEYLSKLTPRQRWIEETKQFQRETNTCRYEFIPRDDGDYDIIDHGCGW